MTSKVSEMLTVQDPRDAEDAVKALHRTEICGMRATVKMAREKEEERAQARDRMLRCEDKSDGVSDNDNDDYYQGRDGQEES